MRLEPCRPACVSALASWSETNAQARAPHHEGLDCSQHRKSIWCPRERGARMRSIGIHMAFQVLDRFELCFGADPGDESDIDLLAIKLAGEVEQEHFEQRRPVVEGRPPP